MKSGKEVADVNYCKMLRLGEEVAHYLYNFGVK
jgi:hypothetical protein